MISYCNFDYSGAFYNMLMSWIEDGAKELPEDMADEFLRILGGNK
ncbi:TetR-like C-terminal domain-containing protein [Clostridium sp.]